MRMADMSPYATRLRSSKKYDVGKTKKYDIGKAKKYDIGKAKKYDIGKTKKYDITKAKKYDRHWLAGVLWWSHGSSRRSRSSATLTSAPQSGWTCWSSSVAMA